MSAAPAEEAVDIPSSIPGEGQKRPRRGTPHTLRELRIGFIGWGAMAQAVSLGLLRKGLAEPSRLMCFDIRHEVLEVARREGLQIAESNKDLVTWSDLVVVGTKPQDVEKMLAAIAPAWQVDKVLVSICAGTATSTYVRALGSLSKVVRVMPNTPCLVGEAASAYAGSPRCTEEDLDLVHGMFEAVGGATHRVPEYLLNTVTGLSGSGPAYVYMLVQALSDAGVHGGLPRNVATSLAAQTVIGAARMVKETGTHPAVLKEAVTSPAGTTIAGVRVLEKHGFNSAIIEAVEAARLRSEQLSEEPDFLFSKSSISSSSEP